MTESIERPAGAPVESVGAARRTNRKALVSVAIGLLGLVIPVAASIVAIVLGYRARSEIAEGPQRGDGLATAGIVLGWSGVFIGIGWVVVFLTAILSAAPAREIGL